MTKTNKHRRLRLVLGLVAVVLCLVLAQRFLTQDSCLTAAVVALEQLSIVGWAALILASSLSFGLALLKWLRLRPAGAGAASLFGLGLGLGTVSIATLILGTLGLTNKVMLLAALLGGLLIGLREVGKVLRAVPAALAKARLASWFRLALYAILALFFMMNLTRAYEPPWDYDSLEYHVAAPAAYDRAGRVFFMRDNVYANFPQNVEMLHFLGMRLTGSPDRGAKVGQMLGAIMGLLAALALRQMLAGLAGRETGDIAALIFYSWAGVTIYSGVPFVELPLIFYGTLALWGLLWSWRRKLTRPGARGWVALAAIATGLALGVKYTAALLVFAPFVAWLLVLGGVGGIGFKETMRRVAIYIGIALLVFSPWLARNFVNTRNPVYPLLHPVFRVFRGTNWDAQKDARWTPAHSPHDRSLATLKEKASEVTFYCGGQLHEWKASLLMVLFVPLVLLTARRTRMVVLFLAVHAAALFLLWFGFTQRNARFLEAGIPVLVALSALGFGAVRNSKCAAGLRPILIILLLFAPSRPIAYINVEHSFGVAIGMTSHEDYLAELAKRTGFIHYNAMRYINDEEKVPPGSKILFLGEARTFYCRRDHVASVVFDTHPLERIMAQSSTPDDVRSGLQAEGITHLYINTVELWRLQESYRYMFGGSERLGMLDNFNWRLFDSFARQHLRLVQVFGGSRAENYEWGKWESALRLYIAGLGPKRPASGHLIALYALR